jgi:gliding motility-associated-like protein
MPLRLLFRWVQYQSWLLALCSLLPALALAQTPPTFDMAARVLAPSPSPRPYTHDVVVDAEGNSYISGQITADAYFGTTAVSASTGNVYVAKLDAAGSYRWVVQLATGRSAIITTTQLALDASGNVYIAGNFTAATLTLGATTLTNVGGSSIFVGKLDPSGNWLSAVRGGGGGSEAVSGLAIDRAGNAYVSGQFAGTTAFGTTTLQSAGGQDFFVARLDAAGTWRWAVRGGGTGADWTSEVGLDANGYAYVAGRLDSGAGPIGLPTLAGATTAILRLAQLTGAVQQVAAIGGAASQSYYTHLAVAPSGACYVAGYFLGELRFGALSLTSVGRGISNDDTFVAKLDATGTWQWANVATGTSGEFCTGVAVDSRSQVYLSGYIRGPGSHFGAITLVSQNSALFFGDVYVAKLDAQGKWLWAVLAGGLQEDTSNGLALGPYATPYVAGDYFSSSMRFGPLTIPGNPDLIGSTFVARMQPNQVRIAGDSLLCNGGAVSLTASTLATAVSWRWNTGATTVSITVTQPGTYVATATFAGGYSLSEQFEVRSVTPSVQITGADAPLCPGTPRQLTAVAPGASSVLWSTGAKTPTITVTQAGTYSVVATYGAGCTVAAQATLTSNELRISGRIQLCPGQSTTLTAAVTGSPAISYRWSTGATTATLRVGQAGTYSVTAVLADGCQLTATHSVGPPVAKVASINGDTLLCPGTTIALTALNADALTYRWSTGATTPTITATQPGLYGVVLTFAGGCSSRDSLQVLPALPAPAFTLGPDTTVCTGQALLLRAPAVSGPGVSWRWSDGSTGPTLLVRTAGTYSLRLSTPCDSRIVSRQVAFGDCLVIPNIITPNGDQQNDRFALPHLPSGNWALTLYNRWGRQVYHTDTYRQDWGGEAPAGLYYYLLRQEQTSTSYRGWLEVVR